MKPSPFRLGLGALLALGISSSAAPLSYTTGLDVWLDASDIDGSDNSTLTDGDPVATWKNKGTTGVNDAVPPTGGGTNVNGLFVASGGNGPQDAVLLNNTRYQFGQEFMDSPNVTIYFVVNQGANSSAAGSLLTDYGTAGNQLLTIRAGASVSGARDLSGTNTWVNDSTVKADEIWATLFFTFDASTQTATFGELGNLSSTTNAAYDPTTTWEGTSGGPVTLFGFHNGDSGHDFNGYVSEVLIFDHVLDAAARATVEAYLVSKTMPPDMDSDGISDAYELANTAPASETALDPALDDDMDGISNMQEYLGLDASDADHGFGQTRANLADTDGDGLDDDEEIGGTLNPYQPGALPGDPPTAPAGAPTNPTDDDSDDDTILDGEEVQSGADGFVTNPLLDDTDDDGLTDGWEAEYGIDPTDDGTVDEDNGEFGDPDEDGLDNGNELIRGTLPNNPDTDDDGYKDGVEDMFGNWLSETETGTDPLNPDSDGDGLLDGEENPDLAVHNPPNEYKTDPNLFDSDGDLFGDGAEVAAGTEPDDINDFPAGNNRDFETGDLSVWNNVAWQSSVDLMIDSTTQLAGSHSLTTGSDSVNRSNTQNIGTLTDFTYSMLFRVDSLGTGGTPRGMDWNLSSTLDGSTVGDLRFKVDSGGIFGIGLNGGTGWTAPLDDTTSLGFAPVEGAAYRWEITGTGFDGTSSASFDMRIFEGETEVFNSTGNTFTSSAGNAVQSVNFIRGYNWGGGGFTVDDISVLPLDTEGGIVVTATGFDGSDNFYIDVEGGVAGRKVTSADDIDFTNEVDVTTTDDGNNRFLISPANRTAAKDFFRVKELP